MKIFKKLSSFGTALLMITSMGPAHAEEDNITLSDNQQRTRNLHIQNSDLANNQNREKYTVMNQKQNQHQYKYMNQYKKKESDPATSFMSHMNTTDRYTQDSAATSNINQQNTAGRSISGGRYAVF